MCQGKKLRRELASIENCVDESIQGLEDYIKKNKEKVIAEASNSIGNIRVYVKKKKNNKRRKHKWEEKQSYKYFKRQTGEIAHKKTWTWLRKGNLKRESEPLLIAVQKNAIRRNNIKAKIDYT